MRRSIRPQSRYHVWLYNEDYDYVKNRISPRVRIPPSAWVREMLHRVVLQLREEEHLQSEAATRLWNSATGSD